MKIQHKRSNVLDGGVAKQPTAGQMEYGELAVNYNEADPSLFIKDSADQIRKIGGDLDLYALKAEAGANVIISQTKPTMDAAGNPIRDGQLWWADTDTAEGGGRLFVWTGDEWVDVSQPGVGAEFGETQADALYLSKTKDDEAAGAITFKGVTTHEAGLTVGDATQARISAGGGGTFAANVVIGGNANAGTEDGLLLNPSGTFNVSREKEQDIIFQGYITGDSTPNITISAGGQVSVTGPSADKNRAFLANQSIGTNITDCRMFYSAPIFTGTGTVALVNHFVAQPNRPGANYTITETNGFLAGSNLAADTVEQANGFTSSLRHEAGKNYRNFYASNTAQNVFEGPLKLEMPVNYWKADQAMQTYLSVRDSDLGPMAGIGHHGGFALGIYAGGYRRQNAEWSSYGLRGKNIATGVTFGTDESKIRFYAETSKQTGQSSAFTTRFEVNETGSRSINFFIQTEADDPAAYQTTYSADGEEQVNYIGAEIDLKAVILELQQAKANLEARVAALEGA